MTYENIDKEIKKFSSFGYSLKYAIINMETYVAHIALLSTSFKFLEIHLGFSKFKR